MYEEEVLLIQYGPRGYYLNPEGLSAAEIASFDMLDEIKIKRAKRVLKVGSTDEDFTLPFNKDLGLRLIDADGIERYAYFNDLGVIYHVTNGARLQPAVPEFKIHKDSYFWQFVTQYTF